MASSQRATRPASSRVAASGSSGAKSFDSSRLVPISSGTWWAAPAPMAASGWPGSTSPSTTGWKGRPWVRSRRSGAIASDRPAGRRRPRRLRTSTSPRARGAVRRPNRRCATDRPRNIAPATRCPVAERPPSTWSSPRSRSPKNRRWTSRIRSAPRPCRASGEATPSSSSTWSESSVAISRGHTKLAPPDWRIARWKSPWARGRPRRVAQLMAPADSPKIVTWSGSPPKASISSRTQVSAATWSRRPSLPVAGSRWPKRSRRRRKPKAPSR